jgi:glucose/arabinose dehydrogenase
MEPFETPSKIDLQAHSAPLGIAFIPEEGWPEMYRGDILIAYHGSWNRSIPTGYKIVRFDYIHSKNYLGDETDFMAGFLNDRGDALGRPVDILAEPGGTLFVSDDRAGVIYRIIYAEEESVEKR